jgi:hypothetical protein
MMFIIHKPTLYRVGVILLICAAFGLAGMIAGPLAKDSEGKIIDKRKTYLYTETERKTGKTVMAVEVSGEEMERRAKRQNMIGLGGMTVLFLIAGLLTMKASGEFQNKNKTGVQ